MTPEMKAIIVVLLRALKQAIQGLEKILKGELV